MAKFTAGPWEVCRNRVGNPTVRQVDALGTLSPWIAHEADAHLMAAAPEMYELLSRAFGIIDNIAHPEWADDFLALFAKIDGVPPPRPRETTSND